MDFYLNTCTSKKCIYIFIYLFQSPYICLWYLYLPVFGEIQSNLISKLNFYKLIPYLMDNCFTGRRNQSRQTLEKDILYILPAGPVTECAFTRWRIVLPSCLDIVTS